MYGIKSYIQRGKLMVNNNMFTGNKKLATLMFYATSLCDSACKHCLVWAKRPPETMMMDKILEIMHSRCVTKNTLIGLEGGEFLLHPQAMDIMKWLTENHPNFDLLSNCLKPERVIEAVKKFPPKRFYVSLDGDKKTYEYIRGKDGYESVIKVVEALHKTMPISLMFCLTPYNTFDDLKFVADIAKKYNCDVRVGIYNNIAFFDTVEKAHETDFGKVTDKEKKKFADIVKEKDISKEERNKAVQAPSKLDGQPLHNTAAIEDSYLQEKIPPIIADFAENIDFLVLYDEWRKKNLRLKCFSIRDSLVILPNGDVPICQNLGLMLGNVYQHSLDEIFNGENTRKLHKEYVHHCNQCWVNFHRKYDVVLYRNLEKMLSKTITQMILGKYHWTKDKKMTYKKYLKSIQLK